MNAPTDRDTPDIGKSRYHRPMTLRAAATWLFGVFVTALALPLISANVRKLASERGWDNGLVRLWDTLPEKFRDKLCWEHLHGLWWLWLIFGLSGGGALALWLIALIVAPPNAGVSVTPTIPSVPNTLLLNKSYFGTDKEGLSNVLYLLSEALKKRAVTVRDEAEDFRQFWDKRTISDNVEKLQTLTQSLNHFYEEISNISASNPTYREEINAVMKDDQSVVLHFRNTATRYIAVWKAVTCIQNSTDINTAIGPMNEIFERDMSEFYGWHDQSILHLEKMKKELR